jgi:hypothetical protein
VIEKDRPESFNRIVQSWDTANKATELSDFSVCTTWGIKGKNLYLLSVLRRRLEYPALKRAVREQSLADTSTCARMARSRCLPMMRGRHYAGLVLNPNLALAHALLGSSLSHQGAP